MSHLIDEGVVSVLLKDVEQRPLRRYFNWIVPPWVQLHIFVAEPPMLCPFHREKLEELLGNCAVMIKKGHRVMRRDRYCYSLVFRTKRQWIGDISLIRQRVADIVEACRLRG